MWRICLTVTCGVSTARASGRHEPQPEGEKKERDDEPDDHALGRSRGGFGTKIHMVVDGAGTPLAMQLSPGQTHDSKMFAPLFDAQESLVIRHFGDPQAFAADKAYGSKSIRGMIEDAGMLVVIPTKTNEHADPKFRSDLYRQRNVVERAFGWLKECRRIATRYEKLAVSYLAMVHLACMLRYFRVLEA